MKPYSRFIFDSYAWDSARGAISLQYSLDDELHFTEKLTIPPPDTERPMPTDEDALDRALLALHLIGGISYYKTCLPKLIEVRSGSLTEKQANFWNSVYEQGLGEFCYRNNIDFRGLLQFPIRATTAVWNKQEIEKRKNEKTKKRILVLLGGGKDSVVTVELLRKAGYDVTLFRMGSHPLIAMLAEEMRLPLLTVERSLDPLLFELNAQGALNGHVPITAYLSFLAIATAILHGFDAIVMSNERSASEGNLEFHGKMINHQWSKSLECERALQRYMREEITPDIAYFSLLRPLSELHIVKLFSEYPRYFDCTTSCNANWRIAKEQSGSATLARDSGVKIAPLATRHVQSLRAFTWCNRCPKCAFVFVLYAAFLPKDTLVQIFGKNLFADSSLLPLYSELLDLQGTKPFECVGTPEETKAALLLAHERGDVDETTVMQMFLEEALPRIKDQKTLIREALTMSDEHAIPPPYMHALELR